MNRDFVLDVHTHTLASSHAYGTIREMTAGAFEAACDFLKKTHFDESLILNYSVQRFKSLIGYSKI